MLTRFLPGSVALVAAFTMPELSVGAGDLVKGGGLADPPEPASKPRPKSGLGLAKPGQAPVKPQLAGVRYAPIINLDLTKAAPLASPPVTPVVMAPVPSGNRPEAEIAAVASAPVAEAATQAFVPTPSRTAPLAKPAIAGAEDRGEALGAASMPAAPVAAAVVIPEAPSVMVPAALPAVDEAPSRPRADSAQVAVPSAPVAPVAAASTALPAARGMIDQVAPARIAPMQTPQPSAAPPAMNAAPVAAAAAAPAARAPVSAAVLAPPTRTAASAPAPDKTAAIVVPRPANPALGPALAAPATSTPVTPAITARLITRVDGKTAGAVDFQQTPGGLKVRLGSIVEVLADRYDANQLARIRASAAGNQYLSLAELQAQGVPISYDPVYDEFNVGLTDTRPKAARKVHMDQISTPERGLGATGMEQVRR